MSDKEKYSPHDNSPFNIYLSSLPCGSQVDFEIMVNIEPNNEIPISWGGGEQEILYCITGSGTIKLQSENVVIERGDRVFINEEQNYSITNTGLSDLLINREGIKFGK